MEINGIKLKSAEYKHEKPTEAVSSSKIETPCYPTMRIDEGGYGSLPLDIEGFKAGDKLILVALCNLKEKTKSESESEEKNDSKVTGEIEFLKVGIEKSEMEDDKPLITGESAKEKLTELLSKMKEE
jgi:hypothetical protein